MLLASLFLGACEQQKPMQDQWASTQAVWLQAEAELTKDAQDTTVLLKAMKDGPQAATAEELSGGLEGALNELRKTRVTVVDDVKRGLLGAPSEERVAAARARMSSALAKVEQRLEAAKQFAHPEVKGDEKKSGDEQAQDAETQAE